jgi:hypothetical protein
MGMVNSGGGLAAIISKTADALAGIKHPAKQGVLFIKNPVLKGLSRGG